MRLSSAVMIFRRAGVSSSKRRQRCGSQISRRPAMSSRHSSIVMTSSTWVAPPVGSGSAGRAMSSAKTIAKLRSPNASTRLPSVLGSSSPSQPSSSSLTQTPAAPVPRASRFSAKYTAMWLSLYFGIST